MARVFRYPMATWRERSRKCSMIGFAISHVFCLAVAILGGYHPMNAMNDSTFPLCPLVLLPTKINENDRVKSLLFRILLALNSSPRVGISCQLTYVLSRGPPSRTQQLHLNAMCTPTRPDTSRLVITSYGSGKRKISCEL